MTCCAFCKLWHHPKRCSRARLPQFFRTFWGGAHATGDKEAERAVFVDVNTPKRLSPPPILAWAKPFPITMLSLWCPEVKEVKKKKKQTNKNFAPGVGCWGEIWFFISIFDSWWMANTYLTWKATRTGSMKANLFSPVYFTGHAFDIYFTHSFRGFATLANIYI